MSLCHSGDYRQHVSSLSSHTVSSPVSRSPWDVVHPLLRSTERGLYCLRRLISHSSEVSAPAELTSSAALPAYELSPNPRKEHLSEYEGGSVFKTLLCPSTFTTASCSFVIPSLCLCHLEYRVRIKGNDHPCDMSHSCETKNPSWVPSLPCVFSALETWNCSHQEGDKTDRGSKGTRWVMCVEKNKYTPPRITVRLGSDRDQRLRMCHESQILSVWEEVTCFPEKGFEILYHVQDVQDHDPTSSVCWAV